MSQIYGFLFTQVPLVILASVLWPARKSDFLPQKRLSILKSPIVFPMRRGFSHHFRFFLFFRFLNCTLYFKGIRLGPRTFWTFFPTFWLDSWLRASLFLKAGFLFFLFFSFTRYYMSRKLLETRVTQMS